MKRPCRVLVFALAACAVPPAEATLQGAPEAGATEWWQGSRREEARGTSAPMTMAVRPILGGDGVIEELTVQGTGRPYRGVAVLLFDRQSQAWTRHYANAVHGRMVPLAGTIQGDRSTWRSAAPDRKRESELLVELLDATHQRRTQRVSEDQGRTWQVLFVDELQRAAAPAR